MLKNKNLIFILIGLMVLGGLFYFVYKNQNDLSNQTASISETDKQNNNSSNISVLDNEIVIGNPNAPVTMVEFSKYSCSHCLAFQEQTLPKIMNNYIKNGQLNLVVRRVSPPALSVAAICADKQGEFEKVDEYIFNNVIDLYKEVNGIKEQEKIQAIVSNWIEGVAKETEINQDRFKECLSSEKNLEMVNYWFDQVESNDITGTPTFFVNDNMITGNQPYSEFEKVINQALGL